jgi:hypothetical protein
MDLKKLLDEAILEGNEELRKENIKNFKQTVLGYVRKISNNNGEIERLSQENEEMKKSLATINFKDTSDIVL